MRAIKAAGAVLLAGVMGTLGACAASAAAGTSQVPHEPGRPHLAAMPRYYVTATAQKSGILVVVRFTGNGAVTGRVTVPAGPLDMTVAAAPDHRSFLIGGAAGSAYREFRVPVSVSGVPGRPAPVRGVSIPLSSGPAAGRINVLGAAVSPDGGRLAVSVQRLAPSVDTFSPSGAIEVFSLVTGRAHVWTSASVGSWAGPPSWAGRNTVAFAWWRVTFSVFPRVIQHVVGIGSVSVTSSGSTLPGSLASVPAALGIRSVAFGPGNPAGLATACVNQPVGGGGHGVIIARFGQISLTSGRFRILASQGAAYHDPGTESALLAHCGTLASVDPSGQHALVFGTGFGRLDAGRFTALPGVSVTGNQTGAAW